MLDRLCLPDHRVPKLLVESSSISLGDLDWGYTLPESCRWISASALSKSVEYSLLSWWKATPYLSLNWFRSAYQFFEVSSNRRVEGVEIACNNLWKLESENEWVSSTRDNWLSRLNWCSRLAPPSAHTRIFAKCKFRNWNFIPRDQSVLNIPTSNSIGWFKTTRPNWWSSSPEKEDRNCAVCHSLTAGSGMSVINFVSLWIISARA